MMKFGEGDDVFLTEAAKRRTLLIGAETGYPDKTVCLGCCYADGGCIAVEYQRRGGIAHWRA